MTKRNESIINRYKKASATDVKDVYTKPSKLKLDKCKECRQKMVDMNGEGFRILGANSYTFSAAFKYKNQDGKNILVFITKDSTTEIEME